MNRTDEQIQELFDLGLYYLNGSAIDLAITIFEELAAQLHAPSLYQLGIIYKERRTKLSIHTRIAALSCDETDMKALTYLKAASGLGHQDACYELGSMLSNSIDTVSDAIDWLKMAAKRGHTKACLMLGSLLIFKRDYEEALSYYTRAANAGNPDAVYGLAMLYFSNKTAPGGFRAKYLSNLSKFEQQRVENYKLGFHFLVKAADLGSAEAQYRLGLLLMEGLTEITVQICESDESRAKDMLGAAAQQGHYHAQDILDGKPPFHHPQQGFG